MTKTVFTDSQNIFVSGGPFKTESKKEKFPPKITLQNTKKGFHKLYELVMDLSKYHMVNSLIILPEKETLETLRLTWMEFLFLFQL